MLIGVKTDHARLLGGVRAVVVDEVHAFAGDDRGWHLLAVLERLERVTGRPIQRVGLSATVGNPAELLHWLQGAGAAGRTGRVVAPECTCPPPAGHCGRPGRPGPAAGAPAGPGGTGRRDREGACPASGPAGPGEPPPTTGAGPGDQAVADASRSPPARWNSTTWAPWRTPPS